MTVFNLICLILFGIFAGIGIGELINARWKAKQSAKEKKEKSNK